MKRVSKLMKLIIRISITTVNRIACVSTLALLPLCCCPSSTRERVVHMKCACAWKWVTLCFNFATVEYRTLIQQTATHAVPLSMLCPTGVYVLGSQRNIPGASVNVVAHLDFYDSRQNTSGGSKGAQKTPAPSAQNFFIFMQFSGKIGQIIGWRPPLGLAPPPLGNPGSATDTYNQWRIRGYLPHFPLTTA